MAAAAPPLRELAAVTGSVLTGPRAMRAVLTALFLSPATQLIARAAGSVLLVWLLNTLFPSPAWAPGGACSQSSMYPEAVFASSRACFSFAWPLRLPTPEVLYAMWLRRGKRI